MDYSLEQIINGPAGSTPYLDDLMKLVAGGAELIFLALVAAWFIYGWLGRRRVERVGAVSAVLAALGALAVNQVITLLWHRPRPFAAHPGVHVLLSRGGDPSFPSDHAAAAFAIAVVALGFHRRIGLGALALAALVGYARVYVGAHYPGDVLGGAVIGIGVAFAITHLLRVVPEKLTDFADGVLRRLRMMRPPETSTP